MLVLVLLAAGAFRALSATNILLASRYAHFTVFNAIADFGYFVMFCTCMKRCVSISLGKSSQAWLDTH